MRGRARAAALSTLRRTVEVFEGAGYRVTASGAGERRLQAGGRPPVRLRIAPDGRIFGGSWALEVATADPVFPATRGLSARGRGAVRLRGVRFRARRGDEAGERLARRLDADEGLQEALAAVHFERVRVDPDGRPVVRHMGGSVVWVLFPPLVRPVPFPPEQVEAVAAALDAFARAAR